STIVVRAAKMGSLNELLAISDRVEETRENRTSDLKRSTLPGLKPIPMHQPKWVKKQYSSPA
ncbi:hypothetical protein L195_g048887, partial [Trifolium pratense]